MQQSECKDCNTAGKVCELHNVQIKDLDLPPKKGSKEAMRQYKIEQVTKALNKFGGEASIEQIVNEMHGAGSYFSGAILPNELEDWGFRVRRDVDGNQWKVSLKTPVTATSTEYETNKTYQDKGPDTNLQVNTMGIQAAGPSEAGRAVLRYVKQKKVLLTQLLNKRGEEVVAGKVLKELRDTIPGIASVSSNALVGIIIKYLIQSEATREGRKVPTPFNESQFLQEISPVLERKQASMKSEIYCPNCDSEAAQTKPGFVSCPDCGYDGPDDFYGVVTPKNKKMPPLRATIEEEIETKEASISDLHLATEDQAEQATLDHKDDIKVAAKGGAEGVEPEEVEVEEVEEPATSLDSSVVSLLDACKNEWTNLGEPVNPATWPKEIERAILDLNDSVTKAIESTQGRLVDGEYYIKNVDEGVDANGGGSDVPGMSDLNLAPAEGADKPLPSAPMEKTPELTNDLLEEKKSSKTAESEMRRRRNRGDKIIGIEPPADLNEQWGVYSEDNHGARPSLDEQERGWSPAGEADDDSDSYRRMSSKTAAVDTTAADTKKAIKFVEDLQDKIAGIFFDYKKAVDAANNSALVKSAGEDMVRLRAKLSEIQKVLDKQFCVLENAEQSVEDGKKKASSNKEAASKNFKGTGCTSCGQSTPNKDRYCDDCKKEDKEEEAKAKEASLSCTTCGGPVKIAGECEGCGSKKKEAKKEVPEFIKKKREEKKEKKEKKESSLFGGLSLVAADDSDEEETED